MWIIEGHVRWFNVCVYVCASVRSINLSMSRISAQVMSYVGMLCKKKTDEFLDGNVGLFILFSKNDRTSIL